MRTLDVPTLGSRAAAFDALVSPSPANCWLWIGSKNDCGYGQFRVDGHLYYAHRLSYVRHVGPLLPGQVVDHTCHAPACVNPAHLRATSVKQNVENRAGANANSSSGVRGVFPFRGRFQARITHQRRALHLGTFDTLAEAQAAVENARRGLFTHSEGDRHLDAGAGHVRRAG